ncbi:glycoside hydrolase family protein [Catenovulum agarivorans DS-2]|uniref:Glycoside hydrolase family protein n=1 Tax=Catenovulum agarivorans DS-2 TaxID=1328313 RepID=W7QMP9_9ALTE|nr:family 16 glycosylhydrolase [Catenovulum agarivorans]EWH10222.1 glycoside hydrolase family protein [Catenovulum agarivorans DS-2]
MKFYSKAALAVLLASSGLNACANIQEKTQQPQAFKGTKSIDMSKWQLAWQDEFNYADEQLDENWISQNGPTENPWVYSSRWRENAQVKDGILHLKAIKESRGGQDWTTGNVWSKRTFGYGYFEARYKYAAAYGTNNSFWFWPKQGVKDGQKACEIDINEGHYPNIINTNVHNWTDTYTLPNGRVTHDSEQKHWTLLGKPDHNIILDTPVKTNKIRLTSSNPASIHIAEFRALAPSSTGYSAPTAELTDNLLNHALASDVKLTTNGVFNKLPSKDVFAIDNKLDTRWVSEKHGKKWLQLEWDSAKEIGAIQFVNGWLQEYGDSKGFYRNLISDYVIEYHNGSEWVEIQNYDAADVANFGEEYHTYGIEWDENYFKFYFDGELYHTMRNDVCFSEQTLLFSLAILKAEIAGPVTDAIDGTAMQIDWVRYYQRKP